MPAVAPTFRFLFDFAKRIIRSIFVCVPLEFLRVQVSTKSERMSRNPRSRPGPILLLVLSTVIGSVLAPQLWKVDPPQTVRISVKDLRRHLARPTTPADPTSAADPLQVTARDSLRPDSLTAEEPNGLDAPSLAFDMLRPTGVDEAVPAVNRLAVPTEKQDAPQLEAHASVASGELYQVPQAASNQSVIESPPSVDLTLADLADMSAPRSYVATAPSVTSQYEPTRETTDNMSSIATREAIEPQVPQRLVRQTDQEEIERQLIGNGDSLEKQPASIVPQVESCWALPMALLERMQPFAQDQRTLAWHRGVIRTLRQLNTLTTADDPATARLFSELQELIAEVKPLAAQAGTSQFRSNLLRTGYALQRRLSVWQAIQQAASQTQLVSLDTRDTRPSVDRCAMILEAQLQEAQNGSDWRTYLRLDKIHSYAQPNTAVSAEWRQKLAREVLYRMHSPLLSAKQRQLMREEPFANLGAALQSWATTPVDYLRLVDDLERFESHGRPSDARQLAETYQRLRWAPAPAANALASKLDSHYRNANIRVAMSVKLMNNMLPQPPTVKKGVNDFVLGSRVFGTSHTAAKLHLTLIPDPHQLRMVLNAAGTVDSNTHSHSGPASFRNKGSANYTAKKLFTIHHQGIQSAKATAKADGRTQLVGVETEYDDIPLLSSLARSIAEQEYDDRRYRANAIMEQRIEQQVATQLDREANAQVAKAKASFEKKILAPLKKRQLNPLALGLETTTQRTIIRYRIAGHHQLAAYTPRPQAPADSLLSVQVHQSAINNTLASLGLAGNEFTLPELLTHLKSTFNLLDLETPQDLPEGVVVRFANEDPIRVLIKDGEVKIALKLSKVAASNGHRWINFYVIATYRPQDSRVNATLTRDDVISIAGSRIGFADRVALQAIFNKVFSQERPIVLLAEEFTQQRGFENARVNQFLCTGGWLGLAVGPESGYVSRRYPSTNQVR